MKRWGAGVYYFLIGFLVKILEANKKEFAPHGK